MLTQTVTITQNSTPNIIIGRRSTYETQQVIFDVSWLVQTYGEGTAELLIKRPKDASAYPVVATLDGNTLTWTVSDTDTQDKGHGECEIYWYVNGGLAKSCICGITILRDIGDTTETAPDPYETWVDELARLGAETLTNAQAAEQSANNAAQSASEAENSAAAALESEENALNSENAAKASEQAAAASEQGAEQNATAARQSATEAAQSASAAESSASDAQESADNASASADRAEDAAASIEGDTERAEAAAREAQGAASYASVFADTASAKATEAAGSAATAEQAASMATQEASDASASATAAVDSASSAYASATAAGNAQTAAETAQSAAETAAQSIEDSAAQIDTNTADILNLKSAFETHEQYAEETYAKQDGDYENLTAGNAYELLSDRGDTNQQPYLFRQTGGDSSAYNREQLKKIAGGTVAWNQLLSESTVSPYAATIKTITPQKVVLVPNGNYSTTLHYGASLTGRALNAIPLNHVLFVCVDCASTQADKFRVRIGNSMFWSASVSANTTTRINAIGQLVVNTLTVYAYDDTLYSTTDEITFQNWNIFDLTQMFGTTIADYIYSLEQATAGAGVTFFRSLFPEDYYDYNPGELKSVEGVSAHETVGFNLFDADDVLIPLGFVKQNDGSLYLPTASTINPGTIIWENTLQTDGQVYLSYEYKNSGGSSGGARFKFVYADGTQGYTYPSNTTEYTKYSAVSTQGKKVKSIAYDFGSGSIATWLKNLCINISDPKRNGTYEPYKKRTYSLDDSLTLRGIPKLDSNNRLYYDGDTYEPDGTVTRRYGVVDLGTLDWIYSRNWGGGSAFYTIGLRDVYVGAENDVIPPILCGRYVAVSRSTIQASPSIIAISGSDALNKFITVRDSAYSDAAAFKAAMSGVMLVYELSTPTTETADPYRELEICDRDGTEEFVSTSIVPVGHETFYPVNVFDYIDRLTEPDADMIADSAIAANKYFSVGNRLFLSTASIAAGAMIIPGTNCTETSLAAALNALNA